MSPHAYDKPRRQTGCGGCLGCASVIGLLVALIIVIAMRSGVPVAQIAMAVGQRALDEGQRALDEAGITHGNEVTQAGEGGTPDSSATVESGTLGFAATSLTPTQQEAYLQLLAGIRRLEEKIVVLGCSSDDINPSYRALMRDHPELFWLDGSCTYTYSIIGGIVTVEPGTLIPLDQVDGYRTQIEATADAFLQTIPAEADDYTTARAAYEYIINTTDYSLGSSYNQSIMSVFLWHSSVCAGYARAYEYLLQRAGIPCAYVEGSIADSGEEHAWNLACLDGIYTYVDPTWGDPTYSGDTDDLTRTGIIYDYLCLTTEEMMRDRHVFADASAWPQCDAVDYDYYRREGLCFDVCDPSLLSGAFWQQEQTGNRMAAFKFTNDEAYVQARDALAAGDLLREELLSLASIQGTDSIRYGYTTSDTLRILKLYW